MNEEKKSRKEILARKFGKFIFDADPNLFRIFLFRFLTEKGFVIQPKTGSQEELSTKVKELNELVNQFLTESDTEKEQKLAEDFINRIRNLINDFMYMHPDDLKNLKNILELFLRYDYEKIKRLKDGGEVLCNQILEMENYYFLLSRAVKIL